MTGRQSWGAYDRAALDLQYDATKTVPSVDPYFERYLSESERIRNTLPSLLDEPYGYEERMSLDLFPARSPGSPALLYLHGGYWRRLGREYFSFLAEPVVEAGGALAVPSYSLAPVASLDRIVQEARWAFAWLYANAAQARANPERLFIAGHSAGAQLAAMLAATDWTEYGMPADVVKGIVAVSGLYDLEPVRLSYLNQWLKLDEASAQRNSPQFLRPAHALPIVAAVGELETDEFKRQTHDFAAAMHEFGCPVTQLELRGRNHYDIVLDLLDPQSPLRKATLDLLSLPGAA